MPFENFSWGRPSEIYFFLEKGLRNLFFLDFLRALPQIINGRLLSKKIPIYTLSEGLAHCTVHDHLKHLSAQRFAHLALMCVTIRDIWWSVIICNNNPKVTHQWTAKQACIKLHRYVYGPVSQFLLRVCACHGCHILWISHGQAIKNQLNMYI